MKEDSNEGKSNEKVEKKDSNISSTRKFIKKLDFSQIEPDEEYKKESKESKPKNEKTEESKQESHVLLTADDFLKLFKVKDIKSGKNKLKIVIGVVAGSLLILGGIYFMLAPVENVADNVIFGEHAVFSVFLILVGIIIIAVTLAPRFMDKSFFKGISTELESDKEVSTQDEKNIRKDNINKGNR
jgi:hypothetical protein